MINRAIGWIKKNPIFIAIFVIGLLFRITGTFPGHTYLGDEILPDSAIRMVLGRTLETDSLMYPSLVPWLMAIVFAVILPINWFFVLVRNPGNISYLVESITGKVNIENLGIPLPISFEIFGPNRINVLYWGRYVTVFAGIFIIFLVYRVAIEYFNNKKIALVAAMLTAVNYRLVLSSKIAFPDTFNVLFLLLSLLAFNLLLKKASVKHYLLSWISIAALFLVKYQFYSIFSFLLVHVYLSAINSERKVKKFVILLLRKEIIIGGFAALLIVVCSHYYHIVNWEKVLEINKYQSLKYGFGVNYLNLYPLSYLYHLGIGKLISLLSLVGIILAFVSKTTRLQGSILLLSILSPLVLYLYLTGGGQYTRNVLTVIPLFIIFASIAIVKITDSLSGKNMGSIRNLCLLILLFLCLRTHIYNDFIMLKTYSKKQPVQMINIWLDSNKIERSSITASGIFSTQEDNVKKSYLVEECFGYQEFLEKNIQSTIVDLTEVRDRLLWWTRQPISMQIKFWEKPDKLLSQSYYSLALRELLWRSSEKSFISPWQAPDNDYIFVEISEDKMGKLIQVFDFGNGLDKWIPLYYFPENKNCLEKNLKVDMMSIISANCIPGSARWESEPLKIIPNNKYILTAEIKNEENINLFGRDGFLRFDFYRNKPTGLVINEPIISFVSARIYGKPGWHKVFIAAIAPEESSYAVIGFQSDLFRTTFHLGQIKIYTSKEGIKSLPKETISDDDLFLYNNGGVL